jgi:uncharacterized membrane protein YfcA
LWASAIGLGIGFYDGFFGPGTGSFFVFLFVRVLGYDFLHASASAKLLNTATNLTALAAFSLTGHVAWPLAAVMAVANVFGSLIGATVGFYDGFFGPGTGSFFVFLFVRLLGYDFLSASAGAKLLNTATNLAALALFAATGHVWWTVAAVMAVANIAGSLAGTRLALRHGSGFVRIVFIAVVGALILKTGYDGFVR